jgi:hypothetical protein
MKKQILLLFFFIFVNTCFERNSNPLDRRINKDKLKISTYNTAFLTKNNYFNFINTIKQINSDILLLNQVQDCNVLELLNTQLSGFGYNFYHTNNIGLLTRIDPIQFFINDTKLKFPIPNSKCSETSEGITSVYSQFITKFEVVNQNNQTFPLLLYGTELSSSCSMREAEALLIKEYLYNEKNSELVVLGCMNDFDENIMDEGNNKPLGNTIDILKNEKLKFYNTLKNVKSGIYSYWKDINQNNKIDEGELSLVDYIFLSKSLNNILKVFHIINKSRTQPLIIITIHPETQTSQPIGQLQLNWKSTIM